MAFPVYQAAVPPCLQMFGGLAAVLAKAAAHATEHRIDPSALLQARLYPDMFPLVRQVQIATDAAKAGGARLAGIEAPSYPDTEASFEELQARIARTVAFLQSLDRGDVDAAGARTISFAVAGHQRSMAGPDYVTGWMLPNFYFHVTTAYAILRHNGVVVGKRDYLGAVPLVA